MPEDKILDQSIHIVSKEHRTGISALHRQVQTIEPAIRSAKYAETLPTERCLTRSNVLSVKNYFSS